MKRRSSILTSSKSSLAGLSGMFFSHLYWQTQSWFSFIIGRLWRVIHGALKQRTRGSRLSGSKRMPKPRAVKNKLSLSKYKRTWLLWQLLSQTLRRSKAIMIPLLILSTLFPSTNEGIPFLKIPVKDGLAIQFLPAQVPLVLKRIDLFPDLEFEIFLADQTMAKYATAISLADEESRSLRLAVSNQAMQLESADKAIKSQYLRGSVLGGGITAMVAGIGFILIGTAVSSDSRATAGVIAGSALFLGGGTALLVVVLPDIKKRL